MQQSDRARVVKALTLMAATYNRDLSGDVLRLYWESLKDLDVDAVVASLNGLIKTSKFFPTIAEIRNAGTAPKTADDKALSDWALVRHAISRYGGNRSVDFGNHVNAVIRSMGGWTSICRSDEEWLNEWGAKDFQKHHRALSGETLDEFLTAPLCGAYGGEPVQLGQSKRETPVLEAKNFLTKLGSFMEMEPSNG